MLFLRTRGTEITACRTATQIGLLQTAGSIGKLIQGEATGPLSSNFMVI
jgi:hypothetical protein